MSAYGNINAPGGNVDLPVLSFPLPTPGLALVTYPVKGANAPEKLIRHLYEIFESEVEGGKTYPQEGPYTYEAFVAYFFAATTIVGIITPVTESDNGIKADLESARGGRDWADCVGGVTTSSQTTPGGAAIAETFQQADQVTPPLLDDPQNCNAGFIVPTNHRGKKLGLALGTSYVEYAPRLGYRGSVFNLVYKNNGPSLAIWDKLGFTRVGIIPDAGRLKTGPDGAEEYVDAVIVYKSFVKKD